MPKMNYAVLYDKVNLNRFASKYFHSDAMRIIDNKTNETIAFQQRYFMFKRLTDYSAGGYSGKYICDDKRISLVMNTFPKMDLNIGYVLLNFDARFKNYFKGE